MKRLITTVSLLIVATFVLAPASYATNNYNSTLSLTHPTKVCGEADCKGDIVDGQLILIGKDGRKHVAPDGTYTGEDGKSIQVIDGRVLQRAKQPMRRSH